AGRLLVNVGVAAFIVALKKRRRGLAAQVAINALLIDVKLARDVLRPLVRFVRHKACEQREETQGLSSGHAARKIASLSRDNRHDFLAAACVWRLPHYGAANALRPALHAGRLPTRKDVVSRLAVVGNDRGF